MVHMTSSRDESREKEPVMCSKCNEVFESCFLYLLSYKNSLIVITEKQLFPCSSNLKLYLSLSYKPSLELCIISFMESSFMNF